MVVFERGCNLLQIVPVGISGTILACSSVGGNNSICMNFQLIQNLVSTPVKKQNVNGIQRPFKNRKTYCTQPIADMQAYFLRDRGN